MLIGMTEREQSLATDFHNHLAKSDPALVSTIQALLAAGEMPTTIDSHLRHAFAGQPDAALVCDAAYWTACYLYQPKAA
jgi:hypothetical protein